jgi:hypothetical protein
MRVPITSVTIRGSAVETALMAHVEADLRAALRVQSFDVSIGEPRLVTVDGYEPPSAVVA